MNTKILKYELFTLFLLTIITLFVFYYKDSLPDNYLSISSNASHGFFSYYLTSGLNFVNYYSGPWVLALCVSFTIFYIFIFSKRADWIDVLNVIALTIFCALTTYYFQPTLLGAGLTQAISTSFSTLLTFSLWFLSLVAFAWGSFRGDFTRKVLEAHSIAKSLDLTPILNKIQIMTNNSKNYFKSKNSSESYENLEKIAQEPISNLKAKEQVPVSTPAIAMSEERKPEAIIAEKVPAKDAQAEASVPVIYVEQKLGIENEDEDEDYVDESQIGLSLKLQTNVDKVNDEKYYDIIKAAPLRKGEQKFSQPEEKYFLDIIDKIQAKLGEFKIQGRIIGVLKGPVVDTFEWELGAGEKLARLTSTAEDLSLALSGAPIRMVHPLKGRTTVGIEVPRNPREFIFLDEVISSNDFLSSKNQLPLAMGKDAFGEPVVVDLATMPHMLVAGSTGAGKSVFINAVLVSLLLKKSPNQMKLILIDPKQLELALYAKLPHLLMPVVTEPKMAANALLWACQEMERRYSIMAEFGVRNLEGFNHKLKKSDHSAIEKIRKFYDDVSDETYELPYIVVIVDEFADLMLSAKKVEIEAQIAKLAAKARAAGIHLILATQRPSVDVITGVIKSNFPTRVSFRVTTNTDSRTILNAMGAERLLGKGDMLYKHGVELTRIHSAYINEDEIETLARELSELAPTFNPNIMEFLENGGEEEPEANVMKREMDEGEQDDKYEEAVKVVLEYRTASASFLQRRLGVGYNRAANLIEELESNGVIGPAQGSKPRKVLIGPESLT